MADIKDFIDPKLIDSLIKINDLIIKNGQSIDNVLLPAIKKLEEAQAKLGKETKENKTERKKLTATQKEAARIAKQLETTETKLLSLQKGQQDALIKTKKALQEETKAKKDNLKVSQAAEGSLVRMRKKLSDLTAAYDKTGNRTKAAAAEIRKLSERIGKAEQATNRHQRGVGSYGRAIKKVAFQLAGALGLTGALFMLVNVMKGGFNTIRKFGKENAVLAGVLGKTRKEVSKLTDQAIQLGSVYPVTASEVTKLQVSFARLGFTMSEIQNLTEATIQGSIALNAELDATATLVGAVVKAYSSLGTTDAQMIIDQLTLATQKSSLSFSSLETAVPKVAAAASALNIPLSKTLSLLGLAQDATLDASVSGTSLRNIFLEISKRGITLNEALNKINTSSNRLTASYDLFGKRGAIVGLALADNTEKIDEFDEALQDAGGTAERVAEVQMATLDGAIKNTASSWEKLILGFRNSEGAMSEFFSETTDLFDNWSSDYTSRWQKFIATFSGEGSKLIADQNRRLVGVLQEISNAGNQQELVELERHFGRMLGDNEKFNEDFANAVDDRYISLAAQQKEEIAIALKEQRTADLEKIAIERESAEKSAEEQLKIAQQLEADLNKIMNNVPLTFEGMLNRMEESVTAKKKTIKEGFADIFEEFGFTEEDEENFDKEIEAFRAAEATKSEILIENEELRKQVKREAGNAVFGIIQSTLDKQLQQEDLTEKEIAKIQRKKAAFAAAQALFNIGLDTFQSVFAIQAQAAIFASNPFTAPLAALALAQIPKVIAGGAIAGALVIGQAIPQFEKGVTNFGGGVAELAEQGTEMVKERSGKVWLAENRGLYNLQQGSTVLTAPQTQKELNDKNIVNELKLTRKAIQRQPRQRTESQFDKRQRGMKDGYHMMKNRLN